MSVLTATGAGGTVGIGVGVGDGVGVAVGVGVAGGDGVAVGTGVVVNAASVGTGLASAMYCWSAGVGVAGSEITGDGVAGFVGVLVVTVLGSVQPARAVKDSSIRVVKNVRFRNIVFLISVTYEIDMCILIRCLAVVSCERGQYTFISF